MRRFVRDWNDAYANGDHIPGSADYPERWEKQALAFRQRLAGENRADLNIAYGDGARNRLDVFMPEAAAKGLVVFVHGGYWMRFDKGFWSHLAEGAVRAGFAVAVPSYTLCPERRISGIGREIAAAIACAGDRVDGPIHLTGHSAGGHLVTRMMSNPSPLAERMRERVAHVVSISGLHDLRPLMRLDNNRTFNIDETEAYAESPALLAPYPATRLTCWAGAGERAEFLRQNTLLANIWVGLGARTACVEEPDRHHFNVIDGLRAPDHPLTRTLLSAEGSD